MKSGKVKEVAAVGIPDEGKGSKIILSIVPLESEKRFMHAHMRTHADACARKIRHQITKS